MKSKGGWPNAPTKCLILRTPVQKKVMAKEGTKSDSKSMCLEIIEIKSNQKCNLEMVIGMLEI